MNEHPIVVLASASSARKSMLAKAGVSFACDPARLDEGEIKAREKEKGSSTERLAMLLAEAKAYEVSNRHPEALVIGADQVLEFRDEWFDKPIDRTQAAKTLKQLRGQVHRLVTAVTVVRSGICVWRHVESPRLTIRPFTDDFLARYLAQSDDGILESVGAYRIEETGIQLFSRIDGDHFTVLGMPLLPLLDFLRQQRVLAD